MIGLSYRRRHAMQECDRCYESIGNGKGGQARERDKAYTVPRKGSSADARGTIISTAGELTEKTCSFEKEEERSIRHTQRVIAGQ
jgi:hypothetical protein